MRNGSRVIKFARLERLYERPVPGLTILRARQFLREFPTHGPAWVLLGKTLVAAGRYEEAEQALSKAIEYSPADIRVYTLSQMGHLFGACGDYDQAAQWYRKAIEDKPTDTAGYIYLGVLLAKQGRLIAAEEALREGTACSEGCVDEAFFNLGSVLRALERFAEAAECYREAIRLDPVCRVAKRALRDVECCAAFKDQQRHKQR